MILDFLRWRRIFTLFFYLQITIVKLQCWLQLLKTHLYLHFTFISQLLNYNVVEDASFPSDYDAASSPPWLTLPSSPWVFSLFHNIGINIFTFIWRIHFFNILIIFCSELLISTWFRLITNVITITWWPENCTWLIQEFSQKHPCDRFDGQIPGDRADHPLCVLAPWNCRSTGCFFSQTFLVQLILILLY